MATEEKLEEEKEQMKDHPLKKRRRSITAIGGLAMLAAGSAIWLTVGTGLKGVDIGSQSLPMGDRDNLTQHAGTSLARSLKGSGAKEASVSPSQALQRAGTGQGQSYLESGEGWQLEGGEGLASSLKRSGSDDADLAGQIFSFGSFGSRSEAMSASSPGDEAQVQQLGKLHKTSSEPSPTWQRVQMHSQPGAVSQSGEWNLDGELKLKHDRADPKSLGVVSRLEKPELHFPQSHELQELSRFDTKPIKASIAPVKAAESRTPAQEKKRDEKMLAKIKAELGVPAPREQLKDGLYDPWAEEYESIVSEEEERVAREARAALKARLKEELLRKRNKRSVGN